MKASEKKEIQLQLNETPPNFSLIIDDMVQEKACTHIEAVLIYCSENDLDPEHVVSLISANLKAKIEEEACANNTIKRQFRPNRLPI